MTRRLFFAGIAALCLLASVPSLSQDRLSEGRLLSDRGAWITILKRYAEAESLLLRAISLIESAGGDKSDLSLTYGRLGSVYEAQGRIEDAEQYYRRALRTNPQDITVTLRLGDLLTARKQHPEAERLYRSVLATPTSDQGYISQAHEGLARIYYAKRDWPRALEAWTTVTDQAIKIGSMRRQFVSQSLTNNEASFGLDPQPFASLVKTAHQIALSSPNELKKLSALTFERAQWITNPEAAQALARMASRSEANSPEIARLTRERQDLRSRWQRLSMMRDGQLRREAVGSERELAEIDQRIAVLDRLLSTQFPAYDEIASPSALSVEQVQQLLGNEEALVFVLVTADISPLPSETFVWVVTRAEVRWIRSQISQPKLGNEILALRCGLDFALWKPNGTADCKSATGSSYGDADRQAGKPLSFDADRAHKLYDALLGGTASLLEGKHLLFVTNDVLAQLPLQVLVTKSPGGASFGSVAWLGRTNAISNLPAVSSLKLVRGTARSSSASLPMVGFGNPLLDGKQQDPDYGENYKQLAQLAREKQRCAGTAGLAQVAGFNPRETAAIQGTSELADVALVRSQPPLPETADELCSIATDLAARPDDIRLGARATERDIKAMSASGQLAKYQIVYFATHGVLTGKLNGRPEPGLIMTPPDSASEEDDGYLSASEISDLKLDADWVILSACNTAAAAEAGGEALSGLARAFFYAQARALLVSHWAVNSNATVTLMIELMREFRDKGVGRAEALKKAMTSLIQGSDTRQQHPEYWAPFSLVGEGARPRR